MSFCKCKAWEEGRDMPCDGDFLACDNLCDNIFYECDERIKLPEPEPQKEQ
jgi:hypothetical protein